MSLLLLAMVVSGGYLAWVWVPLYFDHYTVKQVVTDYMNQAVKNPDDAALVSKMVKKIASLSEVEGVDASGRPARFPTVVVDERSVTWERDVNAKTLRVAFEYEREVVLPFLDRTIVKTFAVDMTGDLTIPDWGPAR